MRKHSDVIFIAPEGPEPQTAVARLWRILRVLFRAIRQSGTVDIVYLRHHPLALPLALMLHLRRTPRVDELNGPIEDFRTVYPWLSLMWPLVREASRLLLKTATAVVVVSDALAAYARDLGVQDPKITVVHNGADLDHFRPDSGVMNEESPYVVFVGAWTAWQGLETALEATELPSWPAGVQLVVAGRGPLEEAVRCVDRQAVVPRGPVPHDEVPRLLVGAVAALSPKTSDARWSSPLKVYEAIACGVPVVVSDVGEQAALVNEHRCGVVVPPQDAAALAEAVAWLVRDRSVRARMGAAAASVRDQIGWGERTAQLDNLIRQIFETAS